MRLLTAATIAPQDVHPRLDGYLSTMTGHCPHLGPSMRRNLTTWCGYEAGDTDGPDLLALLVDAAEDVRAKRRTHGLLVCANIAVFGPRDIRTAKAVLDLPHWIARNLYASVQLMIGKFWIGEEEADRHGQTIAPPPVSFLSIRHSVLPKDARFLSNLPRVAQQLASAHDDHQDVLTPWLGVPLTPETVHARYADLVSLFPAEQKVTT
jgi:hypothetical protein